MTPEGVGVSLYRIAARALQGPKSVARFAKVATASLAQSLLELLGLQIANDIRRLKGYMLDKYGAETTAAEADARRKLAEAAEAENRALLHLRDDLLARAERRRVLAESSKAEAEARKAHAEADVMESMAAARTATGGTIGDGELIESVADLKQAVRRINAKGGGLFLDEAALTQLISAIGSNEPEP